MADVRDAVLSSCRPAWCKVAIVIGRAHERLALPDDDHSYDVLERELAALVESGELQAVGDLSDWRHSEVRLTA